MVTDRSTPAWLGSSGWRVLRTLGSIALHALMLLAVLALWNSDAPQFIYVAF